MVELNMKRIKELGNVSGNLNSPRNITEIVEFFRDTYAGSKYSELLTIADGKVEFTSYNGDFRISFNKYGFNVTYMRGNVFLGRVELKDLYGISILDHEIYVNFGPDSDLCFKLDW